MKLNVSKEWIKQAAKDEDECNLPGILACGGVVKDLNKSEKLYIECDCLSKDHMIVLQYEEEYNEVYIHYQLDSFLGFWRRLYHGTRYILGFPAHYGQWAETIINAEKAKQMVKLLQKLNS